MGETATAKDKFFVIDFDSTFTQVEALEEFVKISLQGRSELPSALNEIKEITNWLLSEDIPVESERTSDITENALIAELVAFLKFLD